VQTPNIVLHQASAEMGSDRARGCVRRSLVSTSRYAGRGRCKLIKVLFVMLITALSVGCAGSRIRAPGSVLVGSVAGIVLDDSTGLPLQLARVLVVRSARDTLIDEDNRQEWEGARQTLTLPSGRFALAECTPGGYLIRVIPVGYERKTVRVKVAAGATSRVTVKLRLWRG
jgi:hypothetical protein